MNRFSTDSRNSRERLAHAEKLLQAGRKAMEAGGCNEGCMFFQEAYFIKASVLGREHPETTAAAETLGYTAHRMQDGDAVAAFFRQRLDEAGETGDPQQLALLGSLIERTGNAFNSHDRLAESGALYTLALEAYGKAGAAEDRTALFLLQKMVGVQYNLGDLAAAQSLAERVVALDERIFGADHPKVAADLSSLGNILLARGMREAARDAYERAVAIEDQQLNWDNPRLANNLTTLGNLQMELDDLHGARASLERALFIDEKGFGPNHPKIATNLAGLADLLRKTGDLPGALRYVERLVALDAEAFGEESPRLAADLQRLGMLQHEAGDLEKARDAYKRALAVNEKALGSGHLKLAPNLHAFADILLELNDTEGAREQLQRALRIYETYLPGDHPEVTAARERLNQIPAN